MPNIGRRRKKSKISGAVSLSRVVESDESLPVVSSEDVLPSSSSVMSDESETLLCSDSESEENPEHGSDCDEYVPPGFFSPKKKKIDFISQDMVTVMDSCRFSSPCTMRFLVPTLVVRKTNFAIFSTVYFLKLYLHYQ